MVFFDAKIIRILNYNKLCLNNGTKAKKVRLIQRKKADNWYQPLTYLMCFLFDLDTIEH